MLTGCDFLTIQARFLKYVHRLPNGCMIWTGGQSYGGAGQKKDRGRGRGGPYGSFWINTALGTRRAHIVWAWLDGKISEPKVPAGMNLDHDCKSGTLCVCHTDLMDEAGNKAKPWRPRRDEAARREALETAAKERLSRVKDRIDRRYMAPSVTYG